MSKPLGKPDRIVVALGGNALGNNPVEQIEAVSNTAHALLGLIEQGNEIIITHGNGPQVGMIQNAFAAAHDAIGTPEMDLPECGAMSQGYIGYDLQNMIGEELDRRGAHTHVATVLTQVAVDPADPAFQHPTKPIGAFMTEEEAKKLAAEKGIDVAEDLTDVTYVHFLFDDHQIVLANGAEAESLHTGIEALKSVGPAAVAEIFAIFPELQDGSVRPTARVLTSGRLGRKLVVRHAQNDKPLVS